LNAETRERSLGQFERRGFNCIAVTPEHVTFGRIIDRVRLPSQSEHVKEFEVIIAWHAPEAPRYRS